METLIVSGISVVAGAVIGIAADRHFNEAPQPPRVARILLSKEAANYALPDLQDIDELGPELTDLPVP